MMWCVVWSSDILCALKWVFLKPLFSSDVNTRFESDDNGRFEVGVEDEVGLENTISVYNDIKVEFYVYNGDSVGWGGVGWYYSK